MLGDSIRRRRRASARQPPDRLEGEVGGGRESRAGGRPGPPIGWPTVPGWLKWSALALLVLVVSFGLGYLAASRLLFPQPDTAGVGVEVPALYGMERESAERVLAEVGLRVGEVTAVASLRVETGRVVAQEPIPAQQLRPGAAVSLALSAGAPEVRVPPVIGLGPQTARDLLRAAGFDVAMREEHSGEVARGRVLRTIPEAGAVVRLPAALTLVVNLGPEEVEPAEPAVTDTGPAVWP